MSSHHHPQQELWYGKISTMIRDDADVHITIVPDERCKIANCPATHQAINLVLARIPQEPVVKLLNTMIERDDYIGFLGHEENSKRGFNQSLHSVVVTDIVAFFTSEWRITPNHDLDPQLYFHHALDKLRDINEND